MLQNPQDFPLRFLLKMLGAGDILHAELSSLDSSVQSEHGPVSKALAHFNLSLILGIQPPSPPTETRSVTCLKCALGYVYILIKHILLLCHVS